MEEAGWQQLPLAQLQLGMYVTAIGGQDRLLVKQSGYLESPQVLAALKASGATTVYIDPSRTRQPPQAAKAKAQKPPISQDQARALYQEARGMMGRLYEDVKLGKAPDVVEAKRHARAFIKGVFENPDALSCLTRIREKDAYLMEHSLNVCILMALFARHLGLDAELVDQLAIAGLLHDIGKIKVRESVLMKPGKLTDAEFEEMKSHVVHSRAILESQPDFPQAVIEVVANHHERLDGKGYPHGLGAERLSSFDRMIAIVDVYDAMTAERVYKAGMAPTQALKMLMELSGSHFDKALVQQFVRCMGIYPVGSLVRLASGRLAVVLAQGKDPLTPRVKVIYHSRMRCHLPAQELDLAVMPDRIEAAEDPRRFGLDLARYL
ncbi:HD-GYP domain-containing protein [Gallaecimonas sp. GXIMD4217]|uniref:HD-GYP domain-containing protein n=1 Tax=Gallaecimonas sp. GXIMD4217 TaxID=3131927 RepID=UPI00311B0C66